MKYQGILEKMQTIDDAEIPNQNGDGVREGWFFDKPTVGQGFVIYTGSRHGLRTSVITDILDDNIEYILFKTLNSVYKLTHVG